MTFLFIFVLSLAVLSSGANGDCPRDDSRRVRSFFMTDVFPVLNTNPVDLPSSCPFHPMHDMYRVHEENKISDYNGEWKCKYCNKRFVSEKYLDRHLDRMHSDLLPENATVCLSDYSKMLGFQPIQDEKLFSGRVSPAQNAYNKLKKSFGAMEKCSPSEVKQLVQQCRDISESCFPSLDNGDRSPNQLKFNALVCNNLKCVNGILKGGLHKDPEQDIFVSTMLRIMCVIILIGVVATQVLFSDSVFHHARRQFFNKGKRDEDYLRKYNTNSEKFGWLVVGIVDSYYAAKAALLYYMKPADKRH